MKTLKDVGVGGHAVIAKLHAKERSSAGLWTWGTPRVRRSMCAKWLPWADPMELTVRGYELSIRKGDAEQIQVE